MFKIRFNKRGVVLLIVLGTLLIVTSLATVILSLILSHRRLTYHQTSRIQAYYAGLAGVNYALDQLRQGNLHYNSPADNSCVGASGCTNCGCGIPNDPDFPNSIVRFVIGANNSPFRVIFCPSGSVCGDTVTTGCTPPAGNNFCIYVTAKYTYP